MLWKDKRELRKNFYDQSHFRRLDEWNRLEERVKNNLNLERDWYLPICTIGKIYWREIHRGGCFVRFTGCLPLLDCVTVTVSQCCIQCYSVTIPQRCSTTGNLPALQLVLSLSTTQVTCPGRQVNPSLLSLLSWNVTLFSKTCVLGKSATYSHT